MASKTGQNHGRDHGPDGSDPIVGYLHFGSNTGTDDLHATVSSSYEFLFTSGTAYLLVNESQSEIYGAALAIQTTGAAGTTIRIASGSSFTVLDSGGNPIFRVDEDGDLHGKTGKALTFDL